MRAKRVFDIKEGVADKYAARKWHIKDPDEEFEEKYQAKLIKENPKLKVIYQFHKGSMIVKNPTSLSNFAFNVRGVISKRGDLYLQTMPFETHNNLVDVLSELGEIKYLQDWWKKYPEDFLTITRHKKTNKFVIGESNDKVYTDEDYRKPKEELNPVYKRFMDIAKSKFPQYEFSAKPFESAFTKGRN